ncbi:MAG: peptidoglycan editing factor PgeF [Alphaproteobacteria bacterium]|nr:MAG: peptidoglycan editing factor PgeF [Alphaproteobacteria bacterium]
MLLHVTPMKEPPAGYLTAKKPLPYAEHIFGTRTGTSIGAATELLGPIAHMHQVHGNRLVYAETAGQYEDCDAIFTDQPNLWLAVKTADCTPVLISSPHAVAAVHLGWRSTQSNLLQITIDTLCRDFSLQPEDLHLALGPSLSQPNFEVETKFIDYFTVPNPQRFFAQGKDEQHVQMDLKGIIRGQAIAAGMLDIHIHTLPNCTYSEKDTFHSYRRDAANSGRQLSFIKLTPA